MIEARSVEVRRVLHAPIDEVFRWWSQTELLERWMSPVGTATAYMDFRVGGSLHIVMKEGAVEIEHRGEFLEIDPPHRIVFTWQSRYTEGPSVVTVTLEPDGEDTRILIVHSGLPRAIAADHAGGWGSMLDRMEREISHEG